MFSGIIEKVADVTAVRDLGNSREITLNTGFVDIELGESIAVNGVCLTATSTLPASTTFFLSPETMSRSNLGGLKQGSKVNLERSVALQTRLSGHMVQGHVDGKASLLSVSPDHDAYLLDIHVVANGQG